MMGVRGKGGRAFERALKVDKDAEAEYAKIQTLDLLTILHKR